MGDHKTVSMQESTTGAVSEFLDKEKLECLQSMKLLAFLAGALHRYEEEGVLLNPRVLLCASIDNFARAIPGGKSIVIGTARFTPDVGKRVLKECAPLARNGWVIFVERMSAEDVQFGVLSFLASPTSVDLRDMVLIDSDQGQEPPFAAILIERVDPKTVLMTGATGNSLRVAFSTTRVITDDASAVAQFACKCTEACEIAGFPSYFVTFLTRALGESHGTILVCKDGEITTVPGMRDAIILSPPVDLPTAFAIYRAAESAESILELQRSESLLTALLQSDGLVVFDPAGRASAYRVFYKPEEGAAPAGEEPATQPQPKVVGGARRRAFEGIKPLVGEHLAAALFRSQDGLTEVVGG